MPGVGLVNKGWGQREDQVAQAVANRPLRTKAWPRLREPGEGENTNGSDSGHHARVWGAVHHDRAEFQRQEVVLERRAP